MSNESLGELLWKGIVVGPLQALWNAVKPKKEKR